MTHDVEELRAALTAHAGQPEFKISSEGVRHRAGQQRTRRAVLGAGVAAFLAVAVGGGTVLMTGDPDESLPAAPRGSLAEAYPGAVHEVSGKLPNGRKYDPITLLDDRRLLVSAASGFERSDGIWIVDLETQQARLAVTLPEPPPRGLLQPSGFTVGSGHVVWWAQREQGGRPVTEIWKAPIEGGTPEVVTRSPVAVGSNVDALVVADGTVYWGRNGMNGGAQLWRAPLSGGDAEEIPGTKGYELVAWPWVGKLGRHDAIEAAKIPGKDEIDPDKVHAFTELRNLVTGETLTADVSKLRGSLCGVTYCIGRGSDMDSRTVVQRRDGTGRVELRGELADGETLPALDRYLLMSGRDWRLHDLSTGSQYGLAPIDKLYFRPYDRATPEGRAMLVGTEARGTTTKVIVDLTAIAG